MNITNEELWEKLESIEAMIAALVRARKGDKVKILREEVLFRKRFSVADVMSYLGVSRPWALKTMKSLGDEPNYRFIKGDKKMKRPSLVIYEDSALTSERYGLIKRLVDEKERVSFFDISEKLNLNIGHDFIIVKELVDHFIEKESVGNSKYYVEDGNKLCKGPD